jgi:hypothetical protein
MLNHFTIMKRSIILKFQKRRSRIKNKEQPLWSSCSERAAPHCCTHRGYNSNPSDNFRYSAGCIILWRTLKPCILFTLQTEQDNLNNPKKSVSPWFRDFSLNHDFYLSPPSMAFHLSPPSLDRLGLSNLHSLQ